MPLNKTCAHCGTVGATCRWFTRSCADGSKNKYRWLCNECDYQLNSIMLGFFKVENAEEKMQRYAQNELSEIQANN